MTLSPSTKSLLAEIHSASGGTLQRSMDLGVLLEIAGQRSMMPQLDDLAFFSKFLSKSFELMKRIGKGGEGYDKLESEFSFHTEKARGLLSTLLEHTDAMTRTHFANTYLAMDTIALQNLMQLFHDLSWYKNYRLDNP